MILNTKQAAGWRNDDGTTVAPHTLYRYVDENGKGGCWYSTIANARRSWDRAHSDAPLDRVVADIRAMHEATRDELQAS